VGYIAVGIGLASPLALTGALLHVVSHAAMKACLFFVAGSVLEQTGSKKLSALTGLGRTMPRTMAAFTIAAVSMVGLPPTAGFFSKWYIVGGAVDRGNLVVALVVVGASVLTLAYFLPVLEAIWFRSADVDAEGTEGTRTSARESRPAVLAPIAILAVAVVALGLANVVIVEQVLEPVTTRLLGA
jgi:multicomponent Na+:H+ antiporter subunit D